MDSRIFISYSRADAEFVKRLIDDLLDKGLNVWLDQRNIAAGQRWDDIIEQAIRECDTFIIVLSPTSVASENVRDEISCAINANKRIIPILYRDCQIPFRIARIQYIDFKSEYKPALQHLIAEIRNVPHTQPVIAKKKKRTGATILGIILGCILLAAILAGGYWAYDHFIAGRTQPTATKRPTSSPTKHPSTVINTQKTPTEAPPYVPPPTETIRVPTEINPTLPPTAQYLSLPAWFLNDPQIIYFQSGGPVNLSYISDTRTGNPCNGSASEAPNIIINMTGDSEWLTFWYKTNNDAFATLLIQMPSGPFFCPETSNTPNWMFTQAPPGDYKIWIGTFGTDVQEGNLYVTYDESFVP